MKKNISFKKMSLKIRRVFTSSILAITVMFSALSFTPLEADAATLLGSFVGTNPALVGTYYDGYQYNCAFYWEHSTDAVNGYYVAIQRVSDGVWVIKETLTHPWDLGDQIYGLKAGHYRFYVSAVDSNYNLIDSHYGVYTYVDYSGTDYDDVRIY